MNVVNNSYPAAVYDPNHTVCTQLNDANCGPNCDYHGDSTGSYGNGYSISI